MKLLALVDLDYLEEYIFIHSRETHAMTSRYKWVKSLCYEVQWSKYKYGEAWQTGYLVLLQTCQLTEVSAICL